MLTQRKFEALTVTDEIDYPRASVTAGILAGGRATRMGGEDKGLVELAGRPMIAYVLEALGGQAGHVLINANRNLARYRALGAETVPDRDGDFLGPLAGMSSLMAVAETPFLLTAPCDSPLLIPDLGPRLYRALAEAGASLAVAHGGERLEPVFALLRCDLRADLEAFLADGERKIDRWYARHHMATVDFSDVPDMFINVNTPSQRDALAARLVKP